MFLLVAVVLLGAGLRLAHLDRKPYWFNEVFTSLKMSGHDEHRHANPALYTGTLRRGHDLLEYQRLRAGSSPIDVIRNLIGKDVKWPPGYWLLTRGWARLWGDSVLAMRSLPALLSLLAFPALYWLCRELFESRSVAWLALALHGVSPVFLELAQQARPWSLTVVLALTATAILLRGLRLASTPTWVAYAGCTAVALYVSLAAVLVLAVHGLYVLSRCGSLRPGPGRWWALATLAAGLAFAPWAACLVWNYQNALATTNHLRDWPGLDAMVSLWSEAARRAVVVRPESPDAWVLLVGILTLAVYASWDLYRRTPARVWSLVTLLTVLPLVVMVVPDLVFRTQVSSRFRYMFPAYLGVQLAVAHLLVGRMGSTGPRAVAWRGLAVLLLTLGATTCLAAVRAETWWGLSRGDVVAGRILREAQHPLIVSRAPYGVVTTLAHMVEPDTPFVLFGLKTPITLPPWAGEVFAYRPSPELARALAPYGVLRPACAESDRDCLLQRLQWR